MRGWGWRWRKGPGRPPKPRFLSTTFRGVIFIPYLSDGTPLRTAEPIRIAPDELEALKLVYLEGLTQEEAANKMGISRGTLWRILTSGRRKLVEAVVNERPIVVEPSYP